MTLINLGSALGKLLIQMQDRSSSYRVRCKFFLFWALLFGVSFELWAQEQTAYSCYSMKVAAQILRENPSASSEELRRLGFITQPVGVVVDSVNQDLILVGKQDAQLPPQYLDDFVVALRAANEFGNKESPGVSIDPDTSGRSQQYTVNYFGGVENTRFGRICYEADYLLKKLALGKLPIGVNGVMSPWARELEWIKHHGQPRYDYRSSSRVWFIPSDVYLAFSRSSLMLYNSDVEVQYQFSVSETAGDWRNPRLLPASLSRRKQWIEDFAGQLSAHYDEVAQTYPVLEELRSLVKLYAIGSSLVKLRVQPDLEYWLSDYILRPYDTPREADLVRQGVGGFAVAHALQGGVSLRALATRIVDGDPEALAKAVLLTRPSPDSLSWVLPIDSGSVHVFSDPLNAYARKLYSQADYFLASDSAQAAVTYYSRVLDSFPRSADVLARRAVAWLELEALERAQEDAMQALELDTSSAFVWSVHGYVALAIDHLDDALRSFNQALRRVPDLQDIRIARAFTLLQMEEYADAEIECDAVLRENPASSQALLIKARIYEARGQSELATRSREEAQGASPLAEVRKRDGLVDGLNQALLSASSSEVKKRFPSLGSVRGHNLWETALSFDVGHSFGNTYDPPTAAILGLNGNLVLSLRLTSTVVLQNKLRLYVDLPFEARSATATAVTSEKAEHGIKAIGVAAGMSNVRAGASFLLLNGLWNRPTLVLEAHYLSGFRNKVYARYWTDSRGDYFVPHKERINIGEENPFYILGLLAEFPLRSAARFKMTGSFMQEQQPGKRTIPGLGLGLRFPMQGSKVFSSIGVEAESIWTNDPDENEGSRRDLRVKAVLDFQGSSVALGVGSASSHSEKVPKGYVFFSWDVGGHLFNHRTWF